MDDIRLTILDPGHFHAALVQKEMYTGVAPRVEVFAPLGSDVIAHLERVARFNRRAQAPTRWELDVHAGPDFVERMAREHAGNVAVLAGKNRAKIGYIRACLEAGLHVLADKPWIIRTQDLPALKDVLALARGKGLAAYDIMTERYEITSMLQKELVRDADVFGTIEHGTEGEPGVRMESMHNILKFVAGAPLTRPTWFFDIEEQGEALTDVGPHLVDLTQWTLFADEAIDYRADVDVLGAVRRPLRVTKEQFRQVTGEPGDGLDYYCDTEVSYTLRGVHVALRAAWQWEAVKGGGDTHFAVYRGTRADIEVRQGEEEQYRPELYVVPKEPGAREAAMHKVAALSTRYAGIDIEDQGARLKVTIPDQHRVGHEAHFAQVARAFFEFVRGTRAMPAWEEPDMLAKYYTTTRGVELARVR